ncbi:MAG: FAD-dependent monooxygenase [Bryobacterales bacterium]
MLIVGAGPTGLALAIYLQQEGIDHVIVDKLEQRAEYLAGGVIHAHTLEVLERIGVAQELLESGIRVTRFNIRDRDRALLRVGFEKLPSTHPYLLMLPQDQTERILEQRLTTLGGAVHRGPA